MPSLRELRSPARDRAQYRNCLDALATIVERVGRELVRGRRRAYAPADRRSRARSPDATGRVEVALLSFVQLWRAMGREPAFVLCA
jgi:hypothetical protein